AAKATTVCGKLAHKAHIGTTVVGFAYAPSMLRHAWGGIEHIMEWEAQPWLERVLNEAGIKDEDVLRANAFDFAKPDVQAATKDMLKSYESTLLLGCKSEETAKKVHDIFERTEKVLQMPEGIEKTKATQALQQELMIALKPSGKDILVARMKGNPADYLED